MTESMTEEAFFCMPATIFQRCNVTVLSFKLIITSSIRQKKYLRWSVGVGTRKLLPA